MMRGIPRRAVTVVELLVGLAILALGVLPVFDLLGGARQRVGTSREMLVLQSQALQLLSEGRARIASGELRQLDSLGEEVLRATRDGVASELKISRIAGGRLLMLFVRAETRDRYYETYQVASDPFTSFEVDLEDPP
jgi:hypothetical protein